MTSVVVTQTTINASVTDDATSVSVTSTPVNVTISPVDINSHSPVTLGTANGLSLSGQVLSLGLSSSGTPGALSSADWITFNNKQNALGFTPVDSASANYIDLTDGGATVLHSHAGSVSDAPFDGATYGRSSGTWIVVSAGISNHALLSNLDYASSGHTGFQASLGFAPPPNTRLISTTSPLAGGGDLSTDITLSIPQATGTTSGYLSAADWVVFNNKQSALSFPLAANLGGSGISNSGTFTHQSNTVVTGGGTVALGGFVLTVPATGTVDLLGTAQTISATKTFTAAQMIDLSSDAIGLTIQGNATQTNPLLTLELSTGVDVLSVDGTGRITQAATSVDHTDDIHNSMSTVLTAGTNMSNSQNYAYDILGDIANSVAITRGWTGLRVFGRIVTAATTTWTGIALVRGGEFIARIESSTSMSVPTAIGGDFNAQSASNRASWIATSAIGGRFNVDLQSNAAHTTASAISLLATTHVKNANITITTGYGLYVEAMTVAATNYAIYTNAGLVHFGDTVDLSSGKNLTLLAGNITTDTTTGTKIGTATTQKIGFWNVTPIIQPAGVNQAALTNSTGGTYNGTLVDVGVVFSQVAINDNFTDVYTLLTEIRTALVNSGIMKGAA